MIGWLASAAALAGGAFSVAERLPDGTAWVVPAGRAGLVTVTPADAPVHVQDAAGGTVWLVGSPDGYLLPAAGTSRELLVSSAGAVRVRLQDDRGDETRWVRYERDVWAAIHRGDPIPPAPWGEPELSARLRLLAQSGLEAPALRAAVTSALATTRPLGEPSHREGPGSRTRPLDGPIEVVGPGTALVSVTTTPGTRSTVTLELGLDGVSVARVEVGSYGTAPVTERLVLPPGRHTLTATLSGDPATAAVSVRTVRPHLAPRRLPPTPAGAGAAELAAIDGVLDGGPVPTGVSGWSDDGKVLVAAAAVGRSGLPFDEVSALVLEAPAPLSVGPVARWLDTLPASRPRGLGLWWATAPVLVVGGSHPAQDRVRAVSLSARWTALHADTAPAVTVESEGTGSPWVDLPIGSVVTVQVPALSSGRPAVVPLVAPAGAVVSVDGTSVTLPPGDASWALPAGARAVTLASGRLWVDAKFVPERDRFPVVHRSERYDLPATFALPDPGATAELRVVGSPGAHLVVAADDGAVTSVVLDEEGRSPSLLAGPSATSVTVAPDLPTGEAQGAVELRTRRTGSGAAAVDGPPLDQALARLAALTASIDRGEVSARAERGQLLLALSQPGLAAPDLEASGTTGRSPRTAPTAGPVGVAAVAGMAGLEEIPSTAETWEAAARLHPEAAGLLLGQASAVHEANGSWVAAVQDALAAGPSAVDRVHRLLLQGRFAPVPRADRSAGLVDSVVPGSTGPTSTWERIRAILLASPWPDAEVVVLRGDAYDRVEVGTGGLSVEVKCRDEGGAGAPCRMTGRADGRPLSWVVPDGRVTVLPELAGARKVEVSSPGGDHVLVVRASVGGAAFPGVLRSPALRCTRSSPVQVTVEGGAVVRVEARTGAVVARAEDQVVTLSGGETGWLALPRSGPARVEVTGEGTVHLARGVPGPDRDVGAVGPVDGPAVVGPDTRALEARYRPGPTPMPRLPGSRGTTTATVGFLRQQVPVAVDLATVEAGWALATGPNVVDTGLWVHAPGTSAGGSVTGWQAVGRSWLAVRAEGATGGGAGHATAALTLRNRGALGLDTDLIGTLTARAGLWTDAPAAAVDPAVWTRWGQDHPYGLLGSLSLVEQPFRELRLSATTRLVSNAGPSLDQGSAVAGVDVLVRGATIASVDLGAALRLRDDDRADTAIEPVLSFGVDHATWASDRDRLRVRVGVAALPVVEGQVTLSWSRSGARGLRDVEPGAELFRSARELP